MVPVTSLLWRTTPLDAGQNITTCPGAHQDCIVWTWSKNVVSYQKKSGSWTRKCFVVRKCIVSTVVTSNHGSAKTWFKFKPWFARVWLGLVEVHYTFFIKIRLSQVQDRKSWPRFNHQWTTTNKTLFKWWISILECCWIYLNAIFLLFVILYP